MNSLIDKLLAQQIKITDIVLDVGCGNKEYSSKISCNKIVTVDAWKKVKPDFLTDLTENDLPFEAGSFDVVLMLDFIEHLDKDRGFVILEQAKNIARSKVVLLTPLWWQDNAENVNNPKLWCYGNPYDYHKSLWSISDFEGWHRILGINNKYFIGIWHK